MHHIFFSSHIGIRRVVGWILRTRDASRVRGFPQRHISGGSSTYEVGRTTPRARVSSRVRGLQQGHFPLGGPPPGWYEDGFLDLGLLLEFADFRNAASPWKVSPLRGPRVDSACRGSLPGSRTSTAGLLMEKGCILLGARMGSARPGFFSSSRTPKGVSSDEVRGWIP